MRRDFVRWVYSFVRAPREDTLLPAAVGGGVRSLIASLPTEQLEVATEETGTSYTDSQSKTDISADSVVSDIAFGPTIGISPGTVSA